MARIPIQRELNSILKGVSRSFYLTLRILPAPVRTQLGIAYLFCRCADTIADTRLLPVEERLGHLVNFRRQFEVDEPRADVLDEMVSRVGGPQEIPAEQQLLCRIGECFALYSQFSDPDRVLIRTLVTTLTQGMETDLSRFPAAESGEIEALRDDGELDRYCYHVAGCVGEFWTDLVLSRIPALAHWPAAEMRELGVRFGKGLQLTNILRDIDGDIGRGRCYLPLKRLEVAGCSLANLAPGGDRVALRPVVHGLIRKTLSHYRAGWKYTLAIPRRQGRLRLACAWPLLIGLKTLALLAGMENPCAGGPVTRIRRREVYWTMWRSGDMCFFNSFLERYYSKLEGKVIERLLPDTGGGEGG
ncbi:MAG: phytoene/squalene synthase family protein [Planctomycetota bacterium]|jgi:farnesyl-diphosphate farnesyltransferase